MNDNTNVTVPCPADVAVLGCCSAPSWLSGSPVEVALPVPPRDGVWHMRIISTAIPGCFSSGDSSGKG